MINKNFLLIKYANMTNEKLVKEWKYVKQSIEEWKYHLEFAKTHNLKPSIAIALKAVFDNEETLKVLEEAMPEKE